MDGRPGAGEPKPNSPAKPVGRAAGRAPERVWDEPNAADDGTVAWATERSGGGARSSCRRGVATQKTNQPELMAGVFLPDRRINRSGFGTD